MLAEMMRPDVIGEASTEYVPFQKPQKLGHSAKKDEQLYSFRSNERVLKKPT